jgi:hypothetical protein
MAYNNGPKIPTDQLKMCLDANNIKSHSGSATTWTDLAQGLPYSKIGIFPLTKSFISGSDAFVANGNGYWEGSTNTSTVDFGGDCTLVMWIYCITPGTRRTIFEKAGNSYSSYQQEIACTWETSNSISWYSRYDATNGYDYAGTAAMTANKWNMVGIKMSTGKTATARTGFYSMDGGTWVNGYNSRTSTAIVPAGNIRIMNGYAGTMESGYLGMVMGYNKMLTDTEISSVFNATRGRFGV